MTENAKAIEHLQTLVGLFSLDDHNKRIDALSWLIDDRARVHAEIERMREQLIHLEACNEQLGIGEVEAMREVRSLRARLSSANALLVRLDKIQPKALGGDVHDYLALTEGT
jgi:hypothetical protein